MRTPSTPAGRLTSRVQFSGDVDVDFGEDYALRAVLVAPDSTVVADAQAQVELTPGANSVTLSFDGAAIFAAGKPGPFKVENLVLQPVWGDLASAARLREVCETALYPIGQFLPAPESSVALSGDSPRSRTKTFTFQVDPATSTTVVELWQRRAAWDGSPGPWSKVAEAQESPFTVTLSDGDGTYDFYSVARDPATGMREAAPSVPDVTTELHTEYYPPTSNILPLPATIGGAKVKISIASSQPYPGIAYDEIWERYAIPGQGYSSWAKVDVIWDYWNEISVVLTPSNGDTSYQFYSVAVDREGRREQPPASADASVVIVPSTLPSSTLGPLPTWVTSANISVPVNLTDNGSGASYVVAYARCRASEIEAWGDWRVVGDASAPTSLIWVSLPCGDGRYELYSVAADAMGNSAAAAGVPEASVSLEFAAAILCGLTAAPIQQRHRDDGLRDRGRRVGIGRQLR